MRRCALLIVLLVTPGAAAQGPGELFVDAAPGTESAPRPGARALRQRRVTVRFERLPGPASGTLLLNLFPDVAFTAVPERVDTISSSYVWIGRLEGVDRGTATLAVTGDAMAGSVVTPDSAYAVRYEGNGVHLVEEVDLQALRPDAPPVAVTAPGPAGDGPAMAAAQEGSTIDLLVVYTPAARALHGGTAGMESLITLGVSNTNQAYANSGATQRIQLVRTEEISYTESGDMGTDLDRLQGTSDGYLDTVHSIRNAYGADIVQLVATASDYCGLAFLMTNVTTGFAPWAFGVTAEDCMSPGYSFAHEMGHNMGLRHDTYVDNGQTPYPYSHGYVNPRAFDPGAPASRRWRDIMAYNDECAAHGFNCPTVGYFSNPANTYNGDPMGNADSADAVRSLNQTSPTVANFRAAVVSKKRRGQLISY